MHPKGSKLVGQIVCKVCSKHFLAHIAQQYCSSECRVEYIKRFGTRKQRECQIKKRLRRIKYRERNRKLGLCKHCAQPVFQAGRCKKHFLQDQAISRVLRAKRDYGQLWEMQVELLKINDIIEEIQNDTNYTKEAISKRA